MKPRTTLILGGILIVLVGIALLVQTQGNRSRSGPGELIFPALSAAAIDGIDLQTAQRNVQLRKRGDQWVVATEGWHEADPNAPKKLLEALPKFTMAGLISTQPGKQADFGVEDKATTVRFLQRDKVLSSFLVGQPGPNYMSTYIRPTGQNSVYLVPVYLATLVDRGTETWRNTMLLDVDQASITGYTAHNAKETVTVEKTQDGKWKITEPIEASARDDIMGVVLRSLSQVRSSGFADSTLTLDAMGLDADTTRVVVRTADGSSYTLQIGSSNERNQSYTKRSDQATVYLVPRGRWNTVFRPSAMLREQEPGPAGAGLPGATPPQPGLPAGAKP